VSVDGHSEFSLNPNQILVVEKSKFSIPCIQPGSSDWLNSITKSLGWNQNFVNGKIFL
jgi:NAD kinase